MKKTLAFLTDNYHYAVFAVFTAFQAWIMRYIVLFGDDYYYTSFLYKGINYFINENITHYVKTNGRAWVHLLDELLLADGTIWMWRIFNTIVISAIVFTAAKIISASKGGDKNVFRASLITMCVFFSVINIKMAYQCVYWATGAVNYLFPVLLLLVYFYLIQKHLSGGSLPLFALPLAFFACSSTEQCAFAALCLSVTAVIIKRRSLSGRLVISAALSFIGAALLFFAPGNAVRQTYYPEFYSMNLAEKLVYNIPRIANLVFSKHGMADILMLFSAAACVRSLTLKRPVMRIAGIVPSLAALISLYVYIYIQPGMAFLYISAACTVIVFAECALYFLSVFLNTGELSGLFFTLASPALQCAMTVSPEFGPRTVLVSFIALFIPTALLLRDSGRTAAAGAVTVVLFAVTLPGWLVCLVCGVLFAAFIVFFTIKKTRGASLLALTAVCVVLTLDREYSFVRGYMENFDTHIKNREEVDEYIEEGDTGRPLTVYYLPNDVYKYTMPYNDPYHAYWYKIAYGIPESTELSYKYPE